MVEHYNYIIIILYIILLLSSCLYFYYIFLYSIYFIIFCCYIYCLFCCNLQDLIIYSIHYLRFDSCMLTLFNFFFCVEESYFIILTTNRWSHICFASVLTLFNDVTGRGNNGTHVGTYRNWEVSKLRDILWKSIKTNCKPKHDRWRNFSDIEH